MAARRGRRLSYEEVLENEPGNVFTDNFSLHPYSAMRDEIRRRFAASAIVKIWGCNSARSGHIYKDTVGEGTSTRNTANQNVGYVGEYYWRALNEQNTPKRSLVQTIANYLNLTTYGAETGSTIEIKHNGNWMNRWRYFSLTGRMPTGYSEHRLTPARGDYRAFRPEN